MSFIIWIKEIITSSIIYLNITNKNLDFLLTFLGKLKNIGKSSRNNASIIITVAPSCHSISFSTSCLTICKNCSIIALYGWINNILCNFIKDSFLFSLHIKNIIKIKDPFFRGIINISLILIFGYKKLSFSLLFIKFYI